MTAPIDLVGTVLILNLRLKLGGATLSITGTVEITPTLPAGEGQ